MRTLLSILFAVALGALAACGATATGDPSTGGTQGPPGGGVTATDPDAGTCPPRSHVCQCATGTYCLYLGAMCMSPSTPCPTGDAGP
jgi:hypothetical protein